ncbi:MAG: hypothetical protein ACTSYC_08540 [Promethearchaeota archaeon]
MTEQENEKEEDLEEERKRIKELGLTSTGWNMLTSGKKNKDE